MRAVFAGFLAASLVVSSAFAAGSSAPLPAGKPAGVKEAALLGPSLFLVLISAGIVIGGITLAVANSNTNGVTTPTTTSTSP